MDGISTAIGLVGAGIKVVKLASALLDDIKNAPVELQSLQDRLSDIDALLQELRIRQLDDIFRTDTDQVRLERLEQRAQTCLNEIGGFAEKMQKRGRDGEQQVDTVKWLMKGDKLEQLSKQLDSLERSLTSMMSIAMSRSIAGNQHQASATSTIQQQNMTAAVQKSTSTPTRQSTLTQVVRQGIYTSDRESQVSAIIASGSSNIATLHRQRGSFIGPEELNASATTSFQTSVLVPLYRLYSPIRHDHFYTVDRVERDNAVRTCGYRDEFPAGYIFPYPADNTVPLYRVYRNGEHFYTTDLAEKLRALTGARDEGIAGYVYSSPQRGTVALHRLYQPQSDNHFYTTSAGEKGLCTSSHGWVNEGIACFIYPTAEHTSPHILTSVKATLYRLYSPHRNEHFYTTDANERDNAVRTCGYTYEFPEAYILPNPTEQTVPLFRIFRNGEYFYTCDAAERQRVILDAVDEGIVGHVYPSQQSGTVALYRLYQRAVDDHFYTTGEGEKYACVAGHGWVDEKIMCWVYPYVL